MKMKKRINMLLVVSFITLAGSATWYSYKAYSNTESDLLSENIEALSYGEYNEEDCYGPSIYSDVGTVAGKQLARTHYNDSTDVEIIYSYTCCYASGRGKLTGGNGYLDVYPSGSVEVPCTNDHVYPTF